MQLCAAANPSPYSCLPGVHEAADPAFCRAACAALEALRTVQQLGAASALLRQGRALGSKVQQRGGQGPVEPVKRGAHMLAHLPVSKHACQGLHVMCTACAGKSATLIGTGPACRTRRLEGRIRLGGVKARTASAGLARSRRGGCAAIIPKHEICMGFLMYAVWWAPWLHGRWTFCASARLHALRQGGLQQSGSHTSGLRRARGGQGAAGPRAAPRPVRPAALALSAAGAVGTWAPFALCCMANIL